MIDTISLFEICPFCFQRRAALLEDLKSMVLSGDDKEMQCDVCNNSFKLHQTEELLELARRQREKRYAK
jgi:hypothetical protein